MAKDPVCGMEVDEKRAAATAQYQGKTYYFCSPGCKATFEKAPERYAASGGKTS
jgi:Cu+-exporting ATPase